MGLRDTGKRNPFCWSSDPSTTDDGKVLDLSSRRRKAQGETQPETTEKGRPPRSDKPTSVYKLEEARRKKALEEGKTRSGIGTSLQKRASRSPQSDSKNSISIWLARGFQVVVLVLVGAIVVGNCTGKKFF
jgi:hypothetical protein